MKCFPTGSAGFSRRFLCQNGVIGLIAVPETTSRSAFQVSMRWDETGNVHA